MRIFWVAGSCYSEVRLLICVTWLFHMYATTYSEMWHDSFVRVTWIITRVTSLLELHSHAGLRSACSYVWHDSFIGVTLIGVPWLVYTCSMTYAHGWLIHMCDLTYSYVWPDVFACEIRGSEVHLLICVTWLCHMCDMTHSYVQHDSCMCVTWLIHTCDTRLWSVWQCCSAALRSACCSEVRLLITHTYLWQDSFIRAM